MAHKGGHIAVFINPPKKNLPTEKCYTDEGDCYSIQKHVIKEMYPKVGCFANFCDHRLMTMSVHMNVYHCPLFESGTDDYFMQKRQSTTVVWKIFIWNYFVIRNIREKKFRGFPVLTKIF